MRLVLWALLLANTAGEATLIIHSEAGTEVLWEGVSLGKTDSDGVRKIQNVPPGVFSITLKKNGFQDLMTRVEVGTVEKIIFLKLERRIAPVNPSPSKISPGLAGDKEIRRQSTQERKPAREETKTVGEAFGNTAEVTAKNTDRAAKSREAPRTSEEVSPSSFYHFYFYLLAIAFLSGAVGGTLYYWKRSRARPVPSETRTSPPQPSGESEPSPATFSAPADLFLEDLKQREKMLQEDAKVVPPKRRDRVIEIDVEDFRKIEGES